MADFTNEQLLSIIIGERRSGTEPSTAKNLLSEGLLGLLSPSIRLRPQQAARLTASIELARRLLRAQRPTRAPCRTPEEAVPLLLADLLLLWHEQLLCLPLDPQSRLIGAPRIVSVGDVDGTDAGPRAFFRIALTAGATSCIAAHNHPSGDPQPSAADLAVTRRLVAAGRTIDVPLVDHMVLGDGARWVSLRRDQPDLFR